MRYVCNDQLTRVRTPDFGTGWTVPRTYRVGDQGERNGMPYTIKAFGVSDRRNMKPGWTPLVWLVIKYLGVPDWDVLLIGNAGCFDEKLVRSKHKNRVFQ